MTLQSREAQIKVPAEKEWQESSWRQSSERPGIGGATYHRRQEWDGDYDSPRTPGSQLTQHSQAIVSPLCTYKARGGKSLDKRSQRNLGRGNASHRGGMKLGSEDRFRWNLYTEPLLDYCPLCPAPSNASSCSAPESKQLELRSPKQEMGEPSLGKLTTLEKRPILTFVGYQ